MSALEAVIGLEVHVQLATRTKLFCRDRVEFGAPPNTHVCPVCLGLPGALPVPNRRAVELAVRAGLGLGCTVHATSIFARKNYFYPDLPKGYQITQFDRPLATRGSLTPELGETVRIRRIHMEEDAGKSIHDRFADRTAVDLNRAGTPLVEIVTEPDVRSPAHARAFLGLLKQTLEYLEVGDCDMEKGSLRVDANVSVRPAGSATLGTKTEVKNMNSFSNVERALEFEIERQIRVVGGGGVVEHQTLLWDANRDEARPMRSKEESHDYRYFPEPDLPPLVLEAGLIDRVAAALPELPAARRARFVDAYGLPEYDAGVLCATRQLADFYEATAAASGGDAKAASNWVMTDVLGWINARGQDLATFRVPPAEIGALIGMVADGRLSSTMARTVFAELAEQGGSAAAIADARGLVQVRDDGQLRAWAEEVVAASPAEAERWRAGDEKLMGHFMGQVMKRSRGKADPRRTTELLREILRRDAWR